jgi:hypothetical protein
MRRQAHCLFGYCLTHPTHFKHDSPRFDYRHPVVWGTLASTLAGFRRLLGRWLIGEDADPDIATTADMAGDGTPSRFNLLAGNPGRLQRLQTKIAKLDLVPGGGYTLTPSPVTLAIFYPFWL